MAEALSSLSSEPTAVVLLNTVSTVLFTTNYEDKIPRNTRCVCRLTDGLSLTVKTGYTIVQEVGGGGFSTYVEPNRFWTEY